MVLKKSKNQVIEATSQLFEKNCLFFPKIQKPGTHDYFILKLFLNPETKVLFGQIGNWNWRLTKSPKKNHPTLVATRNLMPSFTSIDHGQAINLVSN
jgi:hypothetical protein